MPKPRKSLGQIAYEAHVDGYSDYPVWKAQSRQIREMYAKIAQAVKKEVIRQQIENT
jgi:hypothetical protein